MVFKKIKKPVSLNIPLPDNSITFFEEFKRVSELYWEKIELKDCWGFQIQRGSKWKKGLNDDEITEFEKAVGFKFPEHLKCFYKVMNGLDKPGVDIANNTSEYQSIFYSFPDDILLIKEYINWIYEKKNIIYEEVLKSGTSRIFPVFVHRFMMIDAPGNPILSMWGNDIIYWADNISKLLIRDIFSDVLNVNDENKLFQAEVPIKFWFD